MISREETIHRGAAFVEANGGLVVTSLAGLVNDRDEWITALRMSAWRTAAGGWCSTASTRQTR